MTITQTSYLCLYLILTVADADAASDDVIWSDILYTGGSGSSLNVSTASRLIFSMPYKNVTNANITLRDSSKPMDIDIVERFLQELETKDGSSCTPGTNANLGPGVVQQYGRTRFRGQAQLAVNRANLLTELWKLENIPLHQDEGFFFSQVVNLVQSDDEIFAAGNCYDEYEFKDYKLFCPFAYRTKSSAVVKVKDLSVEYPYLDKDSEWFVDVRATAQKLIPVRNETQIQIMNREHFVNGTPYHGEVTNDSTIIVTYEDGKWSNPYFDCGGGDIWMMTYTVPFFGYQDGKFKFKGTSGIDIDLQKVDIDQCDLPIGSTETNVFANSSKCLPETTECETIRGRGFRRGSYKCICKAGYYFPDLELDSELRYFNGTYVEQQYAMNSEGSDNSYMSLHCLPCMAGCDTCEDDKPCEISLNWILRSCLLTISILIMCFIPAIAYFIWKYKEVKVLRAASPKLLWLVLVGAVLLYCPMIVMYFDASEVTCSLKIWLRELGFTISYGALLLKTWRISMVFRVRSATQIKITDSGLIRRLGIVVAVFVVFLIARMIWGRPRVIVGKHKDGLKAYQCSFDAWDYCQAAAELCLLIWGIRLCIVVRKAPSEFNESRFISWAIYNETLLSIFLNLSLLFLQSPANPDLLYIVHFIHTNLTTTVTLVFLFISKAYLVYKLLKKGEDRKGRSSSIRKNTSGSHFKYNTSKPGTSSTELAELAGDMEGKGSQLAWKDVEEELKRVYAELERLKITHMKDGNPHVKQNGSKHLPLFASKLNGPLSQMKVMSQSCSQQDSTTGSARSTSAARSNSIANSNDNATTDSICNSSNSYNTVPNIGTATTTTANGHQAHTAPSYGAIPSYTDTSTQCDNNNLAVVIEHIKPLTNGTHHATVKSINTNANLPNTVLQKVFIDLDDLSNATAV